MKKIVLIIFILLNFLHANETPVFIKVKDTTLFEFTEDFYGIQYNKHAFNSHTALNKIAPLQLKWIRQWAYPSQFHPTPEVWDWTELDQKINTADSLGFNIILCLFQGEEWNIDGTDNCWWDVDSAIVHWKNAARELANRYQDIVDKYLIFDELHYLMPDSKYYISFKRSAEIYMAAAKEIKTVNPGLSVGGPSGFAGWENGHWANYVLQEAGGKEYLDFITSNLFLIWDPEETDETIMDRTIWYEEAPKKIKDMLGHHCPQLILDAYNVNGLWQWEGELWTDPRNTNFLGAIYHALAKLHGAKGNFDIALHWDTLGGYGIFQWYPDYVENPNYFCWKFLIDYANMAAGSHLVDCMTSANPKEPVIHHSGMDVKCYNLQPFAIKNSTNEYNIILINKYQRDEEAMILSPIYSLANYRLYRFDEDYQWDTFPIIQNGTIKNDTIVIKCPSMSISILQIRPETVNGFDHEESASEFNLLQNYPNPFNNETTIDYHIQYSTPVAINIYNILGEKIEQLVHSNQTPGIYQVHWSSKHFPSGIYYYDLRTKNNYTMKKMVVLK